MHPDEEQFWRRRVAAAVRDANLTQVAMIEAYLGHAIPLVDPPLILVTPGTDDSREGLLLQQALRLVSSMADGPTLRSIEHDAVLEALAQSGGVQLAAAKLLGISPRVMNYKIKALGIDWKRLRR